METRDLSIAEMGKALRSGAVTAVKLTQDALERVKAQDDKLHAFVLLTEDLALAQAQRADTELKAGSDRGAFHGIPYALKDIYDTAGIRTTCSPNCGCTTCPPITASLPAGSTPPVQCCSASWPPTNSPSAGPASTCLSRRLVIPGIRIM